jgi:hypothetical protein
MVQGSYNVFAESRPVARFGDKASLGCGKVGQVVSRTTRKTYVNARRVALLNSSIRGPGILRGWVAQASRSVFAG